MALGGKQPLEAKKHEKIELMNQFVLVLGVVEIFWNSFPVGTVGQEGAYTSWIMARECKM